MVVYQIIKHCLTNLTLLVQFLYQMRKIIRIPLKPPDRTLRSSLSERSQAPRSAEGR